MKKIIIKLGLAMVLFISLFVFALNPDLLNIAQEAGQNLLEMLQEFVKRDVVGIV
jgi:hypothetical protein